jgi:signal transduction histidine kinase
VVSFKMDESRYGKHVLAGLSHKPAFAFSGRKRFFQSAEKTGISEILAIPGENGMTPFSCTGASCGFFNRLGKSLIVRVRMTQAGSLYRDSKKTDSVFFPGRNEYYLRTFGRIGSFCLVLRARLPFYAGSRRQKQWENIMKKNIFTKYFSICATLVLVSMAILGAFLMLFSSQYFKGEQYQILESNVEKAISIIEKNAVDDSSFLKNNIKTENFLDIMSEAIDAEIFVVDQNGRTLFCTEGSACTHTAYTIPREIRDRMNGEEYYREMGTLDGIYQSHYCTVGRAFYGEDSQKAGYVMASTENSEQMTAFLGEIFKMFFLSALVVLLLVVVIVYFVTHQMVKPLREMSEAAQEFGKGDFTKRLTVYNYDEIGQLAMALNNMAQSLSTLETMRRSFIANVSHELKTPMTTIGGFIDGILDGTIPPKQQKQYLRIVSDEVKRLSRLVRSMLNLAQVEAGEMQLKIERFDIVDTVCQTLFSLEHQIEEKHLEVRGLDRDKVFVEADQDLIHQVVYNLIENATKFANDGGYLEFEFLKDNGKMMIGVKNSGEGLSREEIPRVFDRFYKTDRSRGLDKNGVGLGLYIVRSIVNLHGGEVIVKSVQGEYCEFLFTLPPAKGQPKLRKDKTPKIEEANDSDTSEER